MADERYLLEVCVDSSESAFAAEAGGADRLELCANLVIGGTTPDIHLFEKVRENCSVPVNVLLRPRYGDFLYSEEEFDIICRDIVTFRRMGAHGIVVGCLKPDGTLDLGRMARMRELAGEMHMTLHRAFDMAQDPCAVLEQAVSLGVDTILTSGQQKDCLTGKELIRELVSQADGRMEILAGGGVNASVIAVMMRETGARSYHMSGKVTLDSGMRYRKQQVSMGIPGMNEYEIFRTSREHVREAKAVLTEGRSGR